MTHTLGAAHAHSVVRGCALSMVEAAEARAVEPGAVLVLLPEARGPQAVLAAEVLELLRLQRVREELGLAVFADVPYNTRWCARCRSGGRRW